MVWGGERATYEGLAQDVGNFNRIINVGLGCAGIGDAVEDVLDVSGVCAETLAVHCAAGTEGDVAWGQALRGAC